MKYIYIYIYIIYELSYQIEVLSWNSPRGTEENHEQLRIAGSQADSNRAPPEYNLQRYRYTNLLDDNTRIQLLPWPYLHFNSLQQCFPNGIPQENATTI
jgi:hypothetical protein